MVCAALAAPALGHSATAIDCKAVSQGALNVELGSMASDVRRVALRPGETLEFTFRAEPGPFGALLEGAGSPRTLLVGPTGTSVSFAAAREGSFGLHFAKESEGAASFTASCAPARSVQRGSARSSAWRRDTVPIGG